MKNGEYIAIQNALTKAAKQAKEPKFAEGIAKAREIVYNLQHYGTCDQQKIQEMINSDIQQKV